MPPPSPDLTQHKVRGTQSVRNGPEYCQSKDNYDAKRKKPAEISNGSTDGTHRRIVQKPTRCNQTRPLRGNTQLTTSCVGDKLMKTLTNDEIGDTATYKPFA